MKLFCNMNLLAKSGNLQDASCKSGKQLAQSSAIQHTFHSVYKCMNIAEEPSIRCNLLINVHSSSVIKLTQTTTILCWPKVMRRAVGRRKSKPRNCSSKILKWWFEIGYRRSGSWMKLMRHTMRHLCDQILLANPTISKMAKVIIIRTTTK